MRNAVNGLKVSIDSCAPHGQNRQQAPKNNKSRPFRAKGAA